jgi:hypothetical protein
MSPRSSFLLFICVFGLITVTRSATAGDAAVNADAKTAPKTPSQKVYPELPKLDPNVVTWAARLPLIDDTVGRSVENLIKQRGKPTSEEVDVRIVGPALKYESPDCHETYGVYRGLVTWGYASGPRCNRKFDTPEKFEIQKVEGYRRFDGPGGHDLVVTRINTRLNYSDFEGLEQLFTELKSSQLRLNDGRWFSQAIGAAASMHPSQDHFYKQVQLYRAKYPRSVGAAMLESLYWSRAAWRARGGGYANTVSPEGWQLFSERYAKAEAALLSVEPNGREHPAWYARYLEVLHHTGRPKKDLFAAFDEAKKRHPGYHELYFYVAHTLTPRWGGDYRQYDRFIREQQRGLSPQEAATLYTRLYWALQGDPGFELFRDSLANWNEMRKGFEVMRTEYSVSLWLLNNYAAFACRAHDKKTYEELRPQFTDYVMTEAWPSNLSIEVCDRRLLGRA